MKQIINIGIIGCGAIARQYHMPALRALQDCQVVAVCDLVPEKAQSAAAFFGLPATQAYTEARDLLTRDDVQGVLILTPNDSHSSLTVLAAEHRKHVFVTKPMARTVEECDRMIEACEKHGVQLFVSFMHRYLLGIREARELIRAEAIGNVEMVRILNAPGATSTVSTWFYDRENVGGGCVIDLGVHGIDLIRYLFGEIKEVMSAELGRFRNTVFTQGESIQPNNEDHAVLVYKTDSDILVNQMISWHHWSNADRFSMEIFGSKGSIFLRDTMGTLNLCKVEKDKPATWTSVEIPYERLGEKQHEAFIDMIRTSSPADPDGAEGLACIHVVRAIYETSESGKPVRLAQ